jgi:hypothetical protein
MHIGHPRYMEPASLVIFAPEFRREAVVSALPLGSLLRGANGANKLGYRRRCVQSATCRA